MTKAGFASSADFAVGSAADEGAYLNYRVRWRAASVRPGSHAARQSGSGGDFRSYRPFWQYPDARRIDVRRSMLDPFDDLNVRQMENRSSITVVVAADLSRSMHASVGASTLGAVAALTRAASRSALRGGDSFGFVGFDEVLSTDLRASPSRARGPVAEILALLSTLQPEGRHSGAIATLYSALPERRCLVLLASDFLMPLSILDAALSSLARHDVAPVVLHDPRDAQKLPRMGLLRLRDAETGRSRLLLMRPSLTRTWQEARTARRAALDRVFHKHGRAAFHVAGALDVPALGEHLLFS